MMRPLAYMLTAFLALLTTSNFAQPFDGYIKFDGFNDALWIDSKDIIPEDSDFTLEFWFKTCNDTGYVQEAIMGNGQDIEVNFFLPPPNTNNIYQICSEATNGTYTCTQDHQFPSDDLWHHLAVTYDHYESEFAYYFDGIYGPTSNEFNFDFALVDTFFVGRGNRERWLWNNFDGYIDEIRMSSVQRYASSFTPDSNEFISDQHTIGLWHMNDSIVSSVVQDGSGNGHDFNVINFPHILIPVDSQRLAHPSNGHQAARSHEDRAIRTQPQSACRVPESGFDIVILEPIDTTSNNDTTANDSTTNADQAVKGSMVISLHPNPADNYITVDYLGQGPILYRISNINGELIKDGLISKPVVDIDISHLSGGVYLFTVLSSASSKTIRFLKLE